MSERNTTTHEVIKRTLIVYKRNYSRNWQCRYRINKSWYRSTTHESELDEAINSANLILMEAHLRERMNVPAVSKRVKDIAKLAIRRMEEEIKVGEGKKIYKDYIFIINRYILPTLGNKFIDQITYNDIEDLSISRIGNMNRVPKHSTMKNHNAAINKIFEEAMMRGFMNEAQKPKLITKGKKSQRRPEFTIEEVKKLLSNIDAWISLGKVDTRQIRYLLKDYICVLIDTGARPGVELLELRWVNITYAEKETSRLIIHFEKSKTGKRTAIARKKTIDALERIAFRNFSKPLATLIQEQNEEYIFRVRSFINPTKLIRPINFEKYFTQYLQYINLLIDPLTKQPRTYYSLRHAYATFALTYDKINIHTLARQMGTSVVMIEKHYSHLDAVKAIEQLGGEITTKLLDN
jgi:integrase